MQCKILKQLRLSKHWSQEQLAEMSGLSVRTIQRIESGQNASLESMKCLAAALDVTIETLQQETLKMNKHDDNWQRLPVFLKLWFILNFLQPQPKRGTAVRVEWLCHGTGFWFCALGFWFEAALVGGLLMLASAYLFSLLKWQGDKYGIWYDVPID
ncbi:helix-turn-helix domain-containing protein [Planctobacterium marinum]|uniref:HTH cro/C1-type domain-containing protein n=1 Tax=Planctobacterium marinum TaxID=1631968 RepID=A0AA48HUX6_9ALTE|nr:hypothetical protein MACH26_39500 [Planctobacterium marinum]